MTLPALIAKEAELIVPLADDSRRPRVGSYLLLNVDGWLLFGTARMIGSLDVIRTPLVGRNNPCRLGASGRH
jgi:hypothetical protein